MSDDVSDQDDSLGALALAAFAVGGALLLSKWIGSSHEETKTIETSDFLQMAQTFTEHGKYNEAIQAARKAIEAHPDDPEPYNLIAWILAINNAALDQALLGARKAIELTSDSSHLAVYYDTLAEVFARTGQLDEAIYHFRKSLELAPNSDEVYRDFSPSFRLALCYLGQGNLNFGLFFLNQALRVQPQNPFVYQVIGDVNLQMQRYIEAIRHYQKALLLSQQWTAFHYPVVGDFDVDEGRRLCQCICWTNIGVVHFYLKEFEKSRSSNEEACRLYQFLPSPWVNLAVLAAREKNEQRMRQYLERGLSVMNPLRDGQVQTYLITTQDFGLYRSIVVSLMRSHGFISEFDYRSLLASTPQDSASPLALHDAKIGVMVVGQGNDIKGGPVSNFYQEGQQVGTQNNVTGDMNIGSQNTAGRDINIGIVRDKEDLIAEIEKLQAQLRKAKSDRLIDAKVVTQANYELEQAVDQANSTSPEKHVILAHLEKAKELVQGIVSAAGIVATLVKLVESIPHLF